MTRSTNRSPRLSAVPAGRGTVNAVDKNEEEALRRIAADLAESDPKFARMFSASPTAKPSAAPSPAPRTPGVSWYKRLEARAAERWARRRDTER